MLRGQMVSQLEGNARIWDLTVPEMPHAGQLVSWSEPACGSIPAQNDVRGWISGDQEYALPGTVIFTVPSSSSRYVRITVNQ